MFHVFLADAILIKNEVEMASHEPRGSKFIHGNYLDLKVSSHRFGGPPSTTTIREIHNAREHFHCLDSSMMLMAS